MGVGNMSSTIWFLLELCVCGLNTGFFSVQNVYI